MAEKISVGDSAPDGRLVAPDGKVITISSLWQGAPLVLNFTRHKG